MAMKVIALAAVFGFIGGAALSYSQTAHHYEAKASKEQAAYVKALDEVNQRADNYRSISEEYYADYQDAISRGPTVVTERVLVRAHCKTDAAANTGGGVGDATATERVELHAETVRSATAVTDQAERDILSCRATLHSLQRKIKAHNELQK